MPSSGPGPDPRSTAAPAAVDFYSPVVRSRRCAAGVLTELRQPRRRRFPRHGHERPYVSLLFAGSYLERCGSRTLEHRPPTVVYHPAGLEHLDEVGGAGASFLIIELEPAWLEGMLDGAPANTERTGGDPRLLAGDLALRAAWGLRRCLVDGAACGMGEEGLVVDLVAGLVRTSRVAERTRPRWLDRVIERLRSEYRGSVSLARLAADAGVHPAHLWRVFQRYENCSPSTYLQRLRCRHVFRRLSGVGEVASLADLALEAGFADQSHCTRVVKRLLGAPPGALRRELRQ